MRAAPLPLVQACLEFGREKRERITRRVSSLDWLETTVVSEPTPYGPAGITCDGSQQLIL